ncbi:MAG: gamma carbonic anhydrase family protein [Candidatus Promineifilaceae bacterium]
MAFIFSLGDKTPQISADAFIAPNATIVGDVIIESQANIWYGVVIRGDAGQIRVGARTSVQDNTVLHVNDKHDTLIGADVTIGHAAVLEGCVIGDGVLIGMNATVLDGAQVGAGALVAAGALVRENQTIPDGMIAAGVPAKVRGAVSAELAARLVEAPQKYQTYMQLHADAIEALA